MRRVFAGFLVHILSLTFAVGMDMPSGKPIMSNAVPQRLSINQFEFWIGHFMMCFHKDTCSDFSQQLGLHGYKNSPAFNQKLGIITDFIVTTLETLRPKNLETEDAIISLAYADMFDLLYYHPRHADKKSDFDLLRRLDKDGWTVHQYIDQRLDNIAKITSANGWAYFSEGRYYSHKQYNSHESTTGDLEFPTRWFYIEDPSLFRKLSSLASQSVTNGYAARRIFAHLTFRVSSLLKLIIDGCASEEWLYINHAFVLDILSKFGDKVEVTVSKHNPRSLVLMYKRRNMIINDILPYTSLVSIICTCLGVNYIFDIWVKEFESIANTIILFIISYASLYGFYIAYISSGYEVRYPLTRYKYAPRLPEDKHLAPGFALFKKSAIVKSTWILTALVDECVNPIIWHVHAACISTMALVLSNLFRITIEKLFSPIFNLLFLLPGAFSKSIYLWTTCIILIQHHIRTGDLTHISINYLAIILFFLIQKYREYYSISS
jgi:hypothetical protein